SRSLLPCAPGALFGHNNIVCGSCISGGAGAGGGCTAGASDATATRSAMMVMGAYYYLMDRLLLIAIGLTACLPALRVAGSEPSLTLEIKDYVELPITGKLDGTGQSDGMLARMNSLREEPGGANRFFINDVNGPMYIVDKRTRKVTTYLDFNGREGHTGLFHR